MVSQLNLWGSAQAYGVVGSVEMYEETASTYGKSRADVWRLLTWRAPLVYGIARLYGERKTHEN